ncbi:dienelactone hydrolase family protein, partial [bacterium]|nr:dienelactone hydrolase family protein [bacterium]
MNWLKSGVALSSVAFASGAAANVKGRAVTYSIDKMEFEGYLVEGGKKGNVLVVHDWMGLTDKTRAKADAVAALGYTVFAVDVFGKNVRPKTPDEARANSGQYYKDRGMLRDRLKAGLAQLVKIAPSKNTAALGYCFGGTSVVELARSGADLRAVVSFHGGLDSPVPADGKNIKARVLALHGADDPFVSAANLTAFEDEMRA